jgi:Bacterial Ig-like domain (group 2)
MRRHRTRLWSSLTLGILGISIALACRDTTQISDASPDGGAQVGGPQVTGGSNILLTAQCQQDFPRFYQYDVRADCVEIYGTGTTLSVQPPPASNTGIEYFCKGWGNPPAGQPYDYEWYEVLENDNNIHDLEFYKTGFIDAVITDELQYRVTVTGDRPTNPGSPALFRCYIDGESQDIHLTVTGPTPVVQTITFTVPTPWFRPPNTVTITPHFRDNYNYLDVMSPVPTPTWTSSQPLIATVSSTGVVTGLARGVTTIQAQVGAVVQTQQMTVEGCSSIAVTPGGPLTVVKGGATATVTATATCDPHIIAANEQVQWISTNPGIVTVAGSGTGGRTGTITGVGAGTTTIKACSILLPNPKPCSSTVTVNVFATQVTSALDGTMPSVPANATGRFIDFSVKNIGPVTGSTTLSCVPTGPITCVSVVPSTANLAPNASQTFRVTYNTGAAGAGGVRANATGGGTDLINVSVIGFVTTVTSPLDGTNPNFPPSSANTMNFTVTNTGLVAGSTNLSCVATGPVSCAGVNPSSLNGLAPNQSGGVVVNFNTTATTGSGSIKLQTSPGGGYDQVFFTITGGPLSVQINYGPNSVRPNVNCEWMGAVNGGIPPYTWVWKVNGNVVPSADNDIYYVNTGSSFTLRAEVTDSQGGFAFYNKSITVTPSAPYCNL